jgi:hypothetical protein
VHKRTKGVKELVSLIRRQADICFVRGDVVVAIISCLVHVSLIHIDGGEVLHVKPSKINDAYTPAAYLHCVSLIARLMRCMTYLRTYLFRLSPGRGDIF